MLFLPLFTKSVFCRTFFTLFFFLLFLKSLQRRYEQEFFPSSGGDKTENSELDDSRQEIVEKTGRPEIVEKTEKLDKTEDEGPRNVKKMEQSTSKNVAENEILDQHRWTVDTLIEKLPELYLVIDLTATKRYYNPKNLSDETRYVKIFTKGHVVPDESVILRFFREVDTHLQEKPGNFDIHIIG